MYQRFLRIRLSSWYKYDHLLLIQIWQCEVAKRGGVDSIASVTANNQKITRQIVNLITIGGPHHYPARHLCRALVLKIKCSSEGNFPSSLRRWTCRKESGLELKIRSHDLPILFGDESPVQTIYTVGALCPGH